MKTPSNNRVRDIREARHLSQITLADQARVSRQTLSAIEAGRSVPSVDIAIRLARALDCKVEQLFGESSDTDGVEAFSTDPAATGRVALAFIGGRWVSLPLAAEGLRLSADGFIPNDMRGTNVVTPARPLAESKENVIVTGCAAALGLVADRLNSQKGPGRFLWFSASSTAALATLAKSATHIAGVHLLDSKTGEANVSFVQEIASNEPLVIVALARWEIGFLVRKEDAAHVRSIEDIGHRKLRLVVRENGAGAQRVLDREIDAAGLTNMRRQASLKATGHLEVARSIAMGAADMGVATRDAAMAFDLHFIARAEERYDLVIPRSLMTDPRIERLLDVLVSSAVRSELTYLGYDVEPTGKFIAEVRAA